MKELHLSIVSPEKSVFDGDVKIVTLPGTIGSFSILPGHAPIVSSLKAGTLSYTTLDGEEHTLDIQGGFVIRGALPSRQLKLILAWCELHRDELMQNWELSKDAKPLNRIAPLV